MYVVNDVVVNVFNLLFQNDFPDTADYHDIVGDKLRKLR